MTDLEASASPGVLGRCLQVGGFGGVLPFEPTQGLLQKKKKDAAFRFDAFPFDQSTLNK